jgi:hypothetical protein
MKKWRVKNDERGEDRRWGIRESGLPSRLRENEKR